MSCNNDYPDSPQPMFAFTTQRVVIEVPDGKSDCPEPKTFKTFSTKNTNRNTHDERKRLETHLALRI